MAKITDVNNTPATGAEATFILKETLKAAGWTIPRSSDGSTYNSSGDQITHASSGAGGMANNSAWFVAREPGGGHFWCFQRGTSNLNWRVKMSAYADFSGGSPDATHTPSSTTEVLFLGAGTDASPTFAALYTTDGTYRWHVIADNAPVGVATPTYGFWAFATITGTGARSTTIIQEPLALGSFPVLSSGTRGAPVIGDADPCVYLLSAAANALILTTSGNGMADSASLWRGWYKLNYADQSFVAMMAYRYIGNTASAHTMIPSGLGVNPYNAGDDGLPIFFGRPNSYSTQVGSKGIMAYSKAKGVNRSYPSTINLASNAFVYVDSLLIPWENGTAPLV